MKQKKFVYLEQKNLRIVWEWAAKLEDEDNQLAVAYMAACGAVGCIKSDPFDDLWEISFMAMQVRDSIGRLILKEIRKSGKRKRGP